MEIKIGENEFRGLLHREAAISDAKRAFSEQLKVLNDVVNYGTNLIPRCFNSSEKTLKDIVILGVLTRQVIAMLDAIEILVSNGAVYASDLQARALLEATVSIDWILQGEIEKKANYFYVHDLRKRRRWAQVAQPGSAEATAFAAVAPGLASLDNPNIIERAKEAVDEIDRVLSQPEFHNITRVFDEWRGSSKSDRHWYRPLGIKSVSGMMDAVGRSAEYIVFYSHWSGTMHSSNFGQHVEIGEGKVTFKNLRLLSGFQALFQFSLACAFHTYRKILDLYRPGELRVFNTKYLERWRTAFIHVPRINYESKPSSV
jgi:hypothetical protein